MKLQRYREIFRWSLTVAKGYWGSVAVCTALGFAKIMLGWSFVLVSKRAVDVATGEADGNLYLILLLLPCIMIGELAISSLASWISQMRNVRLDNRMKQQTFRHLIESKWQGIEKYHTGDVVNRIEGDVASVVTFVTESLPGIVILVFQLIGSFVLLLLLDRTLAWILLGVTPAFLILARVYTHRMHGIVKEVRSSESRIQSQIQESLQYRPVIKTLEQTEQTLGRLTGVMDLLTGQVRQRARLSILTRICMAVGFGLGYFLTFSWGVLQIWQGVIGYGTMVAFLQLSGRVQRPIADLSREIPVLVRSLTSAERLMELFSLPIESRDPQPLLKGQVGVRLRNVSFRYDSAEGSDVAKSSRLVFDGFSFDFKPGQSVAILGETGVGKTTLIRMLLALVQPEAGKVEIYSHDGDVQPLSAFHRRYFSYVPQGNTLLSGTIRSNLQLGCPMATDGEMEEALRQAAADFVFSLPLGLDTPCGERGGGVSEGQAQRIAIARALLHRAPILLLDEATSALDVDTEQKVLDRLLDADRKRLVILVTHRSQAADRCDRALRLA